MIDFKVPSKTLTCHICDFYLECNGFVSHSNYSYAHTFLKDNIEVEINYVFRRAIFSVEHRGEYHILGWTDISIPRVADFLVKANIL